MEETKTNASHLFGWTRNKNKNTKKGTVNRGENYNLNWEKQNYETWTQDTWKPDIKGAKQTHQHFILLKEIPKGFQTLLKNKGGHRLFAQYLKHRVCDEM